MLLPPKTLLYSTSTPPPSQQKLSSNVQVRHLGVVHTVWKGYLECALDGTNLWKEPIGVLKGFGRLYAAIWCRERIYAYGSYGSRRFMNTHIFGTNMDSFSFCLPLILTIMAIVAPIETHVAPLATSGE